MRIGTKIVKLVMICILPFTTRQIFDDLLSTNLIVLRLNAFVNRLG